MASTSLVRRALNNLGERLVTKDTTVHIPKLVRSTEVKASWNLLPRGAYGAAYPFFSPDGGRTIIPLDGTSWSQTALAFVAYWYVATRWRSQKIAEAPLMVVEENQEDGSEEWIPDHELVPILDMPSPDYDMGELLERTSHYLDNTGAALWVIDKDNIGRIVRITPFSRRQFEVQGDGTRLYATFRVTVAGGQKDFAAEEVCYFRDMCGSYDDAEFSYSWQNGRSRLDTALSWLQLGARAQATIRDLLANSVWPSLVVSPAKEWNPNPQMLREYKDEIEQYGRNGNNGKPFVALGGAQVTQLASTLKDLVPTDILNRVESVVAAISGVPAIVLQFEVGLQNSPWSQMAQARRMAYDDTIIPTWTKLERIMTRQILRPIDDDDTHFIRFDASGVSSLQRDQLTQVQVAQGMGKAASLNERRSIMGLEKIDDPKADEVPELTQPSLEQLLAGRGANNGGAGDGQGDNPKDEVAKDPTDEEAQRKQLERKLRAPTLQEALRAESETTWQVTTAQLLKRDAEAIADIVSQFLLEPTTEGGKALEWKSRGKQRVMSAVSGYLKTDSTQAWARTTGPLMTKASERSAAVVAADMGLSFSTLHPALLTFSRRETGRMIKDVSRTTQELVSDVIQGGLDAGATVSQIAQAVRDATGFNVERAKLIARTETTKAFNGAPEQSLAELGSASGRIFTKTWSGALDDRERDEHLAMEGETVPVGEAFSNGLTHPSEPNCRCTLIFDEVDATA